MENNKVSEYVTIDKIREILNFLHKNMPYFKVEPFLQNKIYDILSGKEVELPKKPDGVIVENEHGETFDLCFWIYLRRRFLIDSLKNNINLTLSSPERGIHFDWDNWKMKQRFSNNRWIDGVVEIPNSLYLENKDKVDELEKCIIELEIEIKEAQNVIIESTNMVSQYILGFCSENRLNDKMTNLLLSISKIHLHIGYYVVYYLKCSIIEKTDFASILKSYKNWYKNNKDIGIKPRKREYFYHLVTEVNNVNNLFKNEQLKKHLAEYICKEEHNTQQYHEQAKDKRQLLIDITPQQTLSTETTSANVEESKKVEVIDFVKDINPCIEFDNLFRSDIEGKIEIWNYMLFFKMIDKNGTYLSIGNNTIIRVFVVIMRKHFKLPIAKSVDELIRIFGIKLSISDNVRVRPTPEIELKEQEIIRLLNAFETKTLPFTYVD